jgi:glutamate formiminotransferase
MPWIECVPNVSEGRSPEVIGACRDAIARAGVFLLDTSTDWDHHRSVFTFVGDADSIRRGILALAETALPLIDLRRHTGVHPRLGAVDVVPIVPLDAVSMADCVALARDVAAEVAERHALPVYLYGEAATAEARRRLEHVRGGGFEDLPARLGDPAWTPDFGPSRVHPTAGASIIGARGILVAYNVNLASNRIDVARRIARSVRESSGGLPHVKALGLHLAHRDLAQVSMNLTRPAETSILMAFDAVRDAAAAEGVNILESEIVGLVPRSALSDEVARAIQLRPQDRDRIIEARMEHARA